MPDTPDPDAVQAMEVSKGLGAEVYCRHGQSRQGIYNCEACTAKVIAGALRAARAEGAKHAIEEHEAAICPEDFGCAEYVASLQKQIKAEREACAAALSLRALRHRDESDSATLVQNVNAPHVRGLEADACATTIRARGQQGADALDDEELLDDADHRPME